MAKKAQVEKGIREIRPGVYEVQVHVGRDPDTGRLRQVSRTTRDGIRAARRLRAQLMAEVAEGKHRAPARSAPVRTLATLLDEWVAHGEAIGRSPHTIDGYRKKIDHAIRPALGHIPLEALTTHDIDLWYRRLLEDGVSAAMVLHYHRILSAACRQGVRWGWLAASPIANATAPTRTHPTLAVPPPEHVRALIDRAAASRSPELATAITLAALTGLRRGELCGLRWSDVDWGASAITVRRAIWQTRAGSGVKAPKTHQTRRLVLGDATMAVLAGRWQRATDAAAKCEVPLHPETYVLSPAVDGSLPLMPSTLTQAFTRLCKAEGWRYRLHDLRHYTATELMRAGYNPRTVADRLGHADPAVTLRVYTADTDDQARSAAAALEAGLAPQTDTRL